MCVNRTAKYSGGFTLVELAIVILVIGLLLGSLLGPLSVQIETAKIKSTNRTLLEIQQAIIGFAIVNKRIPCPDTDGDGVEDTPCNNPREGGVPWATLGTGRFDAWNNPIRYRPDSNFTVTIGNPADTATGLEVRDLANTLLTVGNPNAPVAIIYSCGPDGLPNEENDANGAVNNSATCINPGNANTVYHQDVAHPNRFDDILVWVSKSILLSQMVQAGKWP